MFRAYLREAEVLAWPFVDSEAWARGDMHIPTGVPDGLRARLARHAGLADPRSVRDAVWRGNPSVLELLIRSARQLLVPEGLTARLRADPVEPGRELLRWRAISLCIPPSLLLGAVPGDGRPPARVRLLDPTLRPGGRAAHLHLHLGAANSFAALWSDLARRHAEDSRTTKFPAPDGFDDDVWRRTLRVAFRFRAAFRAERPGSAPRLGRGARSDAEALRCAVPAESALGPSVPGSAGASWADLDPRHTDDISETRRRQRLSRELNEHADRGVWGGDPVGDGFANPEVVIVANMLDAVRGDSSWEAGVVQYFRVQTMLYRHLVMDATCSGLESFRVYYGRIAKYQSTISNAEVVSDADGEDLDLHAIEVRVAPPRSVGDLARIVGETAKLPVEQAGVVVHLIRTGSSPKRWFDLWRGHQTEARKVVQALTANPRMLRTVRGIDLASEEKRGPLWLAVDAITELREASRTLSANNWRLMLEPLRLTLHVGEDFDHLLSGLRAVHEPFLWDLVQRGDRLGHALALGIDPVEWAAMSPRAYVRRWDRTLDLLWVRRLVSRGGLDLGAVALAGVADELCGHLRVASPGLHNNLPEAERILDLMGEPGFVGSLWPGAPTANADLRGDGVRSTSTGEQSTARDALLRRLEDPCELDSRAWNDVIAVESAREVPLLSAVGEWLREHVARWQAVVELNPSSNLVVGALHHPLAQPFFQIRPASPNEYRAIPTTISADDPITFATSAADEYAYAWAGMVCIDKVPPGSARAWLDEAAATSWRARFTLPRVDLGKAT